jgi:CRP-like cAMP-binding protein
MSEELIRKLERLDRLSDDERDCLRDLCGAPRRLAPGDLIIREHQHAERSTLLLSGWAARTVVLREGARQITQFNVVGDFVDLHSFLLKRMDHAVQAITPCEIATVPHDRLREVTEQFPHLSRLLWLDTLVDAAIHRRWLTALGRQDGLARVALLLCELHCRLDLVGHDGGSRFALPLTQAAIGDFLGLTTVHVNRLVSRLRADGLVTWSGGEVQILDHPRLEAVAEFDPTYLRLYSEAV